VRRATRSKNEAKEGKYQVRTGGETPKKVSENRLAKALMAEESDLSQLCGETEETPETNSRNQGEKWNLSKSKSSRKITKRSKSPTPPL